MNSIYFPVLKSKQTSFRALRDLKGDSKQFVSPIIEIISESAIPKICSDIVGCGIPVIYVDLIYWDVDQQDEILPALRQILTDSRENGVTVIPITGPDRSQLFHTAIRTVLIEGLAQEVGIRIPASILDPRNLDLVFNWVRSFAGLTVAQTSIFLDLEGVSTGAESYYLAFSVLDKYFDPEYKSFVLLAGAFPEELAPYKSSKVEIPRADLVIWQDLKNSGSKFSQALLFGDYTIRDTAPPFEGFSPDLIPTLRYTFDNSYYVWRGISYRKHENGYNQFNEGCAALIADPRFRGPFFSEGDRMIYEKGVDLNSSPGNAATWAQIGINQHIQFLVHQLAGPVSFV